MEKQQRGFTSRRTTEKKNKGCTTQRAERRWIVDEERLPLSPRQLPFEHVKKLPYFTKTYKTRAGKKLHLLHPVLHLHAAVISLRHAYAPLRPTKHARNVVPQEGHLVVEIPHSSPPFPAAAAAATAAAAFPE